MKKKEIFFAAVMGMCFLFSGAVLAEDYLEKALERNGHQEQFAQDTEEGTETEQFIAEQVSEAETAVTEQVSEPETMVTEQVSEPETAVTEREEQSPAPLQFETVGYDYFDDALFIGDSRTVGIMEYGGLENATFFADSGMSVFGVQKKKISVPGLGKVTLDDVLQEKQYGKIYLMLGMNELGYRFDVATQKYQETVEAIRTLQGEAIIYLCANMHVTAEQSEKDDIYNNDNVNRRNEAIAALADGKQTFYLDVNELFDDENGSLAEEYSSDAFHVLGKYYVDWVDWLCTKAIKLPDSQEKEKQT